LRSKNHQKFNLRDDTKPSEMIKKLHEILAKVTQQVPIMEVMNTKKSRIRQSEPGKQHFRQVTVQYYLTVELLRKPICKGCTLKTFK
jgi:hypothetical protein